MKIMVSVLAILFAVHSLALFAVFASGKIHNHKLDKTVFPPSQVSCIFD
jgi:hypothetical protein